MATNLPVVGTTYTAILQFQDRNNNWVDPSFITFKYRLPVSQVLVTTNYATGMPNFRKIKTGDYEFDIPCPEPGAVWCRYETDFGVMEGEFTVVPSKVL